MLGLSRDEREQRRIAREELRPAIADAAQAVVTLADEALKPQIISGVYRPTTVIDFTESVLNQWDNAFLRKLPFKEFLEQVFILAEELLRELRYDENAYVDVEPVIKEDFVDYILNGNLRLYVAVHLHPYSSARY